MKKGDLIWYAWGHEHIYYGIIRDIGTHLRPSQTNIYANICLVDVECPQHLHNCILMRHINDTSTSTLIPVSELKLVVNLKDKNRILEKLIKGDN